jgi:hypothetical protein
MSSANKLRFGLICCGNSLPAHFASSVRQMTGSGLAELSLLLTHPACPAEEPKSGDRRAVPAWRRAARRLFAVEFVPFFRCVDVAGDFAGVPRVPLSPEPGQPATGGAEQIQDYALDFILDVAFGTVTGDVLRSAKYGVWVFRCGEEGRRVPLPGFWTVYGSGTVTPVSLERLDAGGDASVVLQQGFVSSKGSYQNSLDALLFAAAPMPVRVCRDIAAGRAAYLDAPATARSVPLPDRPNAAQTAALLVKNTSGWLRQQSEEVVLSEDWNIGLVRSPIEAFLEPGFRPPVEWLRPNDPYSFLADPFLLDTASGVRLLAEGFDRRTDRGAIVEVTLDGNTSAPISSFGEGVHLSYPYIFEHEGRSYCTPEAFEKRGVFLYVLDAGTRQWSLAAPLLENFAAVDPTIIRHGGRWWMFCTCRDDQDQVKLYIWHSGDLLGPWEPHAGNPVKIDARSSRPGGTPFVFEGHLYRPAQDCSGTYGAAVVINRVNTLTTTEFSEEMIVRVEPRQDSLYRSGLHTLSGKGGLTVIDGKRWIFVPALVRERVKNKLRRHSIV